MLEHNLSWLGQTYVRSLKEKDSSIYLELFFHTMAILIFINK
jgi:hypothetical protein